VYAWVIALMLGYLALAFVINVFRFGHPVHRRKELITCIFDASLFSGATVLLMGVLNDTVLAAIGDTTPYLIVGGFAGVAYSVKELWIRMDD
jgi:hypothetical protein